MIVVQAYFIATSFLNPSDFWTSPKETYSIQFIVCQTINLPVRDTFKTSPQRGLATGRLARSAVIGPQILSRRAFLANNWPERCFSQISALAYATAHARRHRP